MTLSFWLLKISHVYTCIQYPTYLLNAYAQLLITVYNTNKYIPIKSRTHNTNNNNSNNNINTTTTTYHSHYDTIITAIKRKQLLQKHKQHYLTKCTGARLFFKFQLMQVTTCTDQWEIWQQKPPCISHQISDVRQGRVCASWSLWGFSILAGV